MALPNESFDSAGLNQPSATNRLLQQMVETQMVMLRELKLMNFMLQAIANGQGVGDDLDTLRQDPTFNDFTQMES